MVASGMHQQYSPNLDRRLTVRWHSEWTVGKTENTVRGPAALHCSMLNIYHWPGPAAYLSTGPKTRFKGAWLRFVVSHPFERKREWMGHGAFVPGWKRAIPSFWTGS